MVISMQQNLTYEIVQLIVNYINANKSHATKSKIWNSSSHCKLHCGWPGNLSARLFLTVSLDRWARRAHCIKRNTSTHPGQTLWIFKHKIEESIEGKDKRKKKHSIKRNTSTHPGQTHMLFKHRNRREYVLGNTYPQNAYELKKTHSTL